jgi:predicted ribosomally synthesized peptide with SipW-like signal peptide
MTKINKLGKSTFVIAILSFVLVAVLAFGGTYAYFSATAEAGGTNVTLGTITLTDTTTKAEGETLVTAGTILRNLSDGLADSAIDELSLETTNLLNALKDVLNSITVLS